MKQVASHSPLRKFSSAQEIPSLLVAGGRRLLPNPRPSVWSILLGVGWGVLIVLLLILALDSLVVFPGDDSRRFIYVAQGILKGDVPYLDRWDHKGPLTYLINLIGLVIDDTWGIWVVGGIFLLATVWIAFVTVRAKFGVVAASFALAIFLIYFERSEQSTQGGNRIEQYSLLLQFLALYLFTLTESRGARPSLLLPIGILAALAFFLRPNLIDVWLAIGVYWWIFRRDQALKLTLWSALGAMAVFLPVIAIFASVGGLYAFWDAVLVFNFIYSDTTFAARGNVILDFISHLDFILLPLVIAWGIGLRYTLRKTPRDSLDGLVIVAVILLPIGIMLMSVSGRGYTYYYLAVLPVLAVLMGFFVHVVVKNLQFSALLTSSALLLGVSLYYVPGVWEELRFERYTEKYLSEGGVTKYRDWYYRPTTEYIRMRTEPDDLIVVEPNTTMLHLISERDTPSRFFYWAPFLTPGYRNSDVFDEFASDIESKNPALIIDRRLIDGKLRVTSYPPDSTPYDDTPELTSLAAFVKENYRFVAEIQGHLIYMNMDRVAEEYQRLRSSVPVIRAEFDVYLDGTLLQYLKEPCTPSDVEERFFLHLIPDDADRLPENRKQYGFENLDFDFHRSGVMFDGKCMATIVLPDYVITGVSTGQFTSEKGASWVSGFQFEE